MTVITKCCMCETTQGGLYMLRNPWGDIHFVCECCVPAFKEHFAGV